MTLNDTDPPGTGDGSAQATGTPNTDQRPERALIHRTVEIRTRALGSPGSGRGVLAAIAAGIHPMTEASAYPYTESTLAGLNPQRRVGARRAAAMVATHRDTAAIAKGQYSQIGSTLRRLHAADQGEWPGSVDSKGNTKRTSMSMQIDSLPLLDVEAASQVISGLVGRCARHGIAVDFAQLATTLTNWGDGMNDRSRKNRARVVQDFYGLSDQRTD